MVKTENRAKTFVSHTAIYAIGTVGSRLMMFLLVPIYSFYILPADYGYFDICLNIVMMAAPFLSLQLKDGALRFLLSANKLAQKKDIISTIARTILITVILYGLTVSVIYFIADIKYLWLTYILAVVFAIYEVALQVCRGLEHNKVYAGAGIICAFSICATSLILVIVFNLGVLGIFWGNIIGRVLGLLFIELRVKIASTYINLRLKSRSLANALMKYCLPMLIVNVLIWTMSSSNRFFIEHFLGLTENGIFAVSQKFSAFFETVAFIVFQAWQEMAMKHYNDPDRDSFFSKILHSYVWFLSMIAVLMPFGLKLIYPWIVGEKYQSSILYLLPFISASLITYLSLFYDVGYQCAKKTHKAVIGLALTTFLALAGNYFLIPKFSLYGALIVSNISYGCLLIYRIVDTRSYFKLNWSAKSIISLLFVFISLIAYYFTPSALSDIIWIIITITVYGLLTPGFAITFLKDKISSFKHKHSKALR